MELEKDVLRFLELARSFLLLMTGSVIQAKVKQVKEKLQY